MVIKIIRWVGAGVILLLALAFMMVGAEVSGLFLAFAGVVVSPLSDITIKGMPDIFYSLGMKIGACILAIILSFIAIPTSNKSSDLTSDSEVEQTVEEKTMEDTISTATDEPEKEEPEWVDLSKIPEYKNNPAYTINGGKPYFTEEELSVTDTFESYGDLDNLGRCTQASALLSKETMPTEERGQIGSIQPSGWQTVKYDDIDGLYLYNRCHLIAYELCGQNDNEKNLITGTRYMNLEGMLPFEDKVASYLKESDNHVLYRSTPVFDGNNLVASGVVIEALSLEDNGKGISICAYCYNVQPGIAINYKTGESEMLAEAKEEDNSSQESSTQSPQQNTTANTAETTPVEQTPAVSATPDVAAVAIPSADTSSVAATPAPTGGGDASNFNTYNNVAQQQTSETWVLNTSTMKIHYPGCPSVAKIAPQNYATSSQSLNELMMMGYQPCKNCFN